jgi:hypothetical protein
MARSPDRSALSGDGSVWARTGRRGRRTVKVAPCPRPGLSAVTRPAWSSTRCRTMASPSPSPLARLEMLASDWRNRSKTCGRNSGVIPSPVSLTTISTLESTRSRRISTRPPRGVNLIPFATRFHTTCWRRAGSPETGPACESRTEWTRTPLASAIGLSDSRADSIAVAGMRGWTSSRIVPVMMRETSRRSSMTRACARAFRSITSTAWRSRASLRSVRRSTCAHPRMALSGVRSSCETVARNSSLSWPASSARALAACSRARS